MDNQDKKCKDKVRSGSELSDRISDLRKLWKAEQDGNEDGVEDLGTLNEYGLCFDYVPRGTFADQKQGYFRYQLSTGGPADEFRFFCESVDGMPYKVEYWFLDWFDGANITLHGTQEQLLMELFDYITGGEAQKMALEASEKFQWHCLMNQLAKEASKKPQRREG